MGTARGTELDQETAARAFGDAYFNLIRRGADGSLRLSADHWRLSHASAEAFHFAARESGVPEMVLPLKDVRRFVWDRLPKQTTRSQIRAQLANGDVWTFSGAVDETALPQAGD